MIVKMKRSVIQLAGKTLVVSLPSKWVKRHGVKKGDDLEIVEKSNAVICSIEKRKFQDTIAIDITGLAPMVKRIIASLYKAGFDELSVTYSSAEEFKRVQEVLSDTCIGFELLSKKDNLLIIKNISKIDEQQYDNLLRRSWLTLLEMVSELEDAFKEKDPEGYDSVIASDLTLNRFTDFCRRTLNTGSYVSSRPLPEYTIIETLEKVGDAYKDLAKLLKTKGIKDDTGLTTSLKKTEKMLRSVYGLFYDFSYEGLTRFREAHDGFDKDCDRLYPKLDKDNTRVLMSLQQISGLLFDLNGPLIARSAESESR